MVPSCGVSHNRIGDTMSPEAKKVMKHLSNRKLLCIGLVESDNTSLFAAELEAQEADEEANRRPSKESIAVATFKKRKAEALRAIRDDHEDEIKGITEILNLLSS